MIHIRQHVRLLASISLITASLAATPLVSAQQGRDDPTLAHSGSQEVKTAEARQQSQTSASDDSTNTTMHTEIETHNSQTTTTTSDAKGSDSLRDRAQQLLDDKRQNRKAKTQAELQKICENHQADINKKIANLGNRADKHLSDFNAIFTRVQAYQTKNQLDVSNYDALLSDATAKQAAATTAVASLKSVAVTVDCTTADPAANIATVKTAANDARTALQTYRTSLKSLIEALIAAKPVTSDNTTTGGN